MKQRITVQVDGLDAAASGAARITTQTPGAAARALNTSMQESREKLIKAAKERYALTTAGEKHLDELRQTERASASKLRAVMRIARPRSDMGYYESFPNVPLPGPRWKEAPKEGFRGHVLRSTPMYTLSGGQGNRSKAFLAQFKSGHVGMVNRLIGENASRPKPSRWRTKDGRVEPLETLGSPSGAAQVNTVWPEQEREAIADFRRSLAELMEAEQ